jgi:hypothetical protein
VSRHGEICIGRENAEVIEIVGSSAVVSVGILKLAEVIQSVDLFQCYLHRPGQVNLRRSDNENIELHHLIHKSIFPCDLHHNAP